jgi:asparaginyl-tRNA synthetase
MPKYTAPCSFIKDLYEAAETDLASILDTTHTLWGHCRSIRTQSGLAFITIYDGTHLTPFQILLEYSKHQHLQQHASATNVGAFVKVKGVIVKSPAKGQLIEMHATDFELAGAVVDPFTYLPVVKGVSLETLRGNNAYLRSKFQTFYAVFSIRDKVDKFVNDFMRLQDYKHLDPNILTANDCEGAGESFSVSTPSKDPILALTGFFGKKVGLTVSSQLQLEALVPAAKGVYTLNKSFRAEQSKTSRHLAEFTHLEWESKFVTDVKSLMDFNEDLIVYVIKNTLKECARELFLLNSFASKGILERLESFVKEDFARITYTEAIEILERDAVVVKKLYDIPEIPKWGDDLGSKCERYLAEHIYKRPLFVYNYPRDLKSFYMKQNPPDEKGRYTVQGSDLLIPFMGELIGSSVREEKYDVLLAEMKRRAMDVKPLEWYLDLRKNGGCRTAGAGIGFERLVQILCFMESNIRDVVPFPVAFEECCF